MNALQQAALRGGDYTLRLDDGVAWLELVVDPDEGPVEGVARVARALNRLGTPFRIEGVHSLFRTCPARGLVIVCRIEDAGDFSTLASRIDAVAAALAQWRACRPSSLGSLALAYGHGAAPITTVQ